MYPRAAGDDAGVSGRLDQGGHVAYVATDSLTRSTSLIPRLPRRHSSSTTCRGRRTWRTSRRDTRTPAATCPSTPAWLQRGRRRFPTGVALPDGVWSRRRRPTLQQRGLTVEARGIALASCGLTRQA